MTTLDTRRPSTSRPLVAVVCSVPLLGEALGSTLEFADVRSFSSTLGDVAGLLRSVRPDAVIVDGDRHAEEAAELGLPVVHISVREHSLRLFRRGRWEPAGNGEGPTPEAIRNTVAGALFARAEEDA